MSYRRDTRTSKLALFDGHSSLEEGLRTSDRQISNHDNDKAMDSLQDRVIFLKRLTGDIHDEVESHNRMLDHMGNGMDASRGIMSGTMDRFKKVFEKKSNRQMCKLAGYFVVSFLLVYFLIRSSNNLLGQAVITILLLMTLCCPNSSLAIISFSRCQGWISVAKVPWIFYAKLRINLVDSLFNIA